MKKIVIALGGNALGSNPKEQLEIVKNTAKKLVDIVELGVQIVITHGNGPQVGMIYNAMAAVDPTTTLDDMPFAECGAMSQGYIGYHLQQAIERELASRNMRRKVVTVVSQVEVSIDDNAFSNPTKPIGSFYSKSDAEKLAKESNATYKEDAGRGYRRVIASPMPKKIVELPAIKRLVDEKNIVITCGGGGIPIIKTARGYKGVDAVIDKDRTSALLAKKLDADMLIILTTVNNVKINYNKSNEKNLKTLNLSEAKDYIASGEFASGSMLPKVEACIDFVKYSGKKAIITSLSKAASAIKGDAGTVITKD